MLEVKYPTLLPDSFISKLQVRLRHFTLLGGSWRYGCCLCVETAEQAHSQHQKRTAQKSGTFPTTAGPAGLGSPGLGSAGTSFMPIAPQSQGFLGGSLSRLNSGTSTTSSNTANLTLQLPGFDRTISINSLHGSNPSTPAARDKEKADKKAAPFSKQSYGILLQNRYSIFVLTGGVSTGKKPSVPSFVINLTTVLCWLL